MVLFRSCLVFFFFFVVFTFLFFFILIENRIYFRAEPISEASICVGTLALPAREGGGATA